ncbi:MAG: hypothetical protein AMXMBFR22_12790 [Phycisphaerae bacterium]
MYGAVAPPEYATDSQWRDKVDTLSQNPGERPSRGPSLRLRFYRASCSDRRKKVKKPSRGLQPARILDPASPRHAIPHPSPQTQPTGDRRQQPARRSRKLKTALPKSNAEKRRRRRDLKTEPRPSGSERFKPPRRVMNRRE